MRDTHNSRWSKSQAEYQDTHKFTVAIGTQVTDSHEFQKYILWVS